MAIRLKELAAIYSDEGIEAAEEALRGHTDTELGALRVELSCLLEYVEDAKPAAEFDEEE